MTVQTPELNKQQKAEVQKEVSKQVDKIEEKLHKKLLSKSKKTAVYLSASFKTQASTAMIAAFGFLIALVWRDLIIKVVDNLVKIETLQSHPYLAELYTAIIVTIIAIVGITLISNWAKK